MSNLGNNHEVSFNKEQAYNCFVKPFTILAIHGVKITQIRPPDMFCLITIIIKQYVPGGMFLAPCTDVQLVSLRKDVILFLFCLNEVTPQGLRILIEMCGLFSHDFGLNPCIGSACLLRTYPALVKEPFVKIRFKNRMQN